jgi:Flp pilus assembly pilin Flp
MLKARLDKYILIEYPFKWGVAYLSGTFIPINKASPKKRRQTMNYLNELYVRFMNRIKNEKGQTMVEYALLLVLVALVCAGFMATFTGGISTAFTKITTQLNK